MKAAAIIVALLALSVPSLAAETIIYPQLPRDRRCAAIVDHEGANVTVLIRCKGYIDWVVYSGARVKS